MAMSLPSDITWVPTLRAVVCEACKCLVGSGGISSEEDVHSYASSIYHHRQRGTQHGVSVGARVLDMALRPLYQSAAKAFPDRILFEPSHLTYPYVPELEIFPGYYCPAARLGCTFVSRSIHVAQGHRGKTRHGEPLSCYVQQGFAQLLVRVDATEKDFIAQSKREKKVESFVDEERNNNETENQEDTLSDDEKKSRKRKHSESGDRMVIEKDSKPIVGDGDDAEAKDAGDSLITKGTDGITEDVDDGNEDIASTDLRLKVAKEALLEAGWSASDIEHARLVLADRKREHQLMAQAIAASYLISNLSLICRVLGYKAAKRFYIWKKSNAVANEAAYAWGRSQSRTSPFIPPSPLQSSQPPPQQTALPSPLPLPSPPPPLQQQQQQQKSPSSQVSSLMHPQSTSLFTPPPPCLTCLALPPSSLCYPCAHVVLCEWCKPSTCPQCTAPITHLLTRRRLFIHRFHRTISPPRRELLSNDI